MKDTHSPIHPDNRHGRCCRLKKTCSSQTPAPPRKRKAPKSTRVAELEKRLEDLTARVDLRPGHHPHTPPDTGSPVESKTTSKSYRLLGSGPMGFHFLFPSDDLHDENQAKTRGKPQGQQPSPSSIRNKPTFEDAAVSYRQSIIGASIESQGLDEMPSAWPQQAKSHQQWQRSSRRDEPSVCPSSHELKTPWYYLSSEEAEQHLEYFKTEVVPTRFPFVVVPPEVTAEQLRRDRPLLWKGIMLQGLDKHARRQVLLGTELLKEVVEAAYLVSKTSLDLLQALQVLIAP